MEKLKKSFRRLKTELYYIYRLFNEGYGWRYWYPYAKHRFLWRQLVSSVPRYDYQADPDLELHTICQKKDLWMLIWSFRSFLLLSGLRPKLIIHDDGSLDPSSATLVESKFANVQILFRADTARLIAALPGIPEIVKRARQTGHFFLDRPIYILALSRAKKIIITDTDILFFKPPTEVIDFVMGRTSYDALASQGHNQRADAFDLMMDEYYTQKHNLREKSVQLVNGGYLVINREKLNLDQLTEYLEHTKRPLTDYFIDMAYSACMLAQLNFRFLPLERYHFKGPVTGQTVFKHFTSPRRYEMFAYGFDLVKNILERKKQI